MTDTSEGNEKLKCTELKEILNDFQLDKVGTLYSELEYRVPTL